jgi:hypothetical protein
MSYQLSRRVAADLFEGEYIIANLDTGLYYSLLGSGIYFLKNLPFNDSEELIQKLSSKFSLEKEVIEKDLNAVWTELEKEAIVVFVEGESGMIDFETPEVFEPSSFNSYADMQDLLALDPIHEVDEEGWEKKHENES